MAEKLSSASEYEQMFGVRHRRAGRPEGVDGEPIFPSRDRPQLLVAAAQRRAYAVVHEEQKQRLSELFEKEIRVLSRRGLEQVASDMGVVLVDDTEMASV